MSLLNASDFGDLAAVSSAQATRKPGKFFNISICGKRRKDQQVGTYQCPKIFDGDEYFVHNAQSVKFIPLYVKRYWTQYTDAKDQKGETYQKLVGFGWDEKSQKPEGAKSEYIVAGYLLNDNGAAVKHQSDMDDREIKAGDNVFVYFKCSGIKCGCAFDLINRCGEAAAKLTPLSDNPDFEKSVVNIRRFAIESGITSRDTSHGSFDVYDFKIFKQLPDEVVAKIIQDSKKYLEDFNYQFDKSETIKSGSSEQKEQLIENGTDTSVTIDEVPSMGSAPSGGTDQFSIDL